MLDPVAAYDRIAPVFARVAEERRPYLAGIDRLVISGIPPGSRFQARCALAGKRLPKPFPVSHNIAVI